MGQFDVHMFLTHCYVSSRITIGSDIIIQPFYGIGVMDTTELMDKYLYEVLKQPLQPQEEKLAVSNQIRESDTSVVITFANIQARNHNDAIKKSTDSFLLFRDILTFRQLQRGYIASYISIQNDISPVQLHALIHRPYPILRKVRNLPISETESDIISRFVDKTQRHPILRVYLSLYADSNCIF